jgi:hypothetical protein
MRTLLALAVVLLGAPLLAGDDPTDAARRAEAAATRAESAADRSEAAAARVEAAINRLERLMDEAARREEGRGSRKTR